MDDLFFRSQVDGRQLEFSLLTGLDFAGVKSVTRQEFLDDSLTANILARFGTEFPQRPVQFGEVDFDLTLQGALEASRNARESWSALPADVRARYRGWPAVLEAVASGELVVKDGAVSARPEPVAAPVVPPVAVSAV